MSSPKSAASAVLAAEKDRVLFVAQDFLNQLMLVRHNLTRHASIKRVGAIMGLTSLAAAPAIIFPKHPRRNAGLGLLAASLFYGYILKFSEHVLMRKSSRKSLFGAAEESLKGTVMKILFSTCGAREAWTTAKLVIMLLVRTYSSLWIAQQWGRIVQSTVRLEFKHLTSRVLEFATATVFLSFLNSLLKFYHKTLKLQVREKITSWCHDQYMRPHAHVYYLRNKVCEERFQHFEHQISSDVSNFSQLIADVFSQVLKPTVDFFVYSQELARVQGVLTPVTLFTWFGLTSIASAATMPPFTELVENGQTLEGEFIGKHTELVAHSEQVAFLRGDIRERQVLEQALENLVKHYLYEHGLAYKWEIVRQYLSKYFVTVIGLLLVSRPLFRMKAALKAKQIHDPRAHDPRLSADVVAAYFTGTWKNMEAMARSIQDLFELAEKVGCVGGYASRLGKLMELLEERPIILQEELRHARYGANAPVIQNGNTLKLENVTLRKPDGQLLVKDLNLEVKAGERVLITGPNGCGKSTLFRVLAGLWPLIEGKITIPKDWDMHFIPQIPFVPQGTLRDLVLYPKKTEDFRDWGRRQEEEVCSALKFAHVSPYVIFDGRAQLEFLENGAVFRPELWDVRDWNKELSPGQKQRISFARLFFHRPKFAVLDECTNGVSSDVEHDLYERCRKLNMAVFTISHKVELKLFHDQELHYKGNSEGGWTLSPCSEKREDGKVTFASAIVRLPEPDINGKTENRITYERHVWFVD